MVGLAARVNITGAEAANDRLTINALAGDDVIEAPFLARLPAIQLTANGGNGDDVIIGGAGNDVLTGGAGDDVLIGGPARTSSMAGPWLFASCPITSLVLLHSMGHSSELGMFLFFCPHLNKRNAPRTRGKVNRSPIPQPSDVPFVGLERIMVPALFGLAGASLHPLRSWTLSFFSVLIISAGRGCDGETKFSHHGCL